MQFKNEKVFGSTTDVGDFPECLCGEFDFELGLAEEFQNPDTS